MIDFGRAFNALADPIGRSVLTLTAGSLPDRARRGRVRGRRSGSRTRCRCNGGRRSPTGRSSSSAIPTRPRWRSCGRRWRPPRRASGRRSATRRCAWRTRRSDRRTCARRWSSPTARCASFPRIPRRSSAATRRRRACSRCARTSAAAWRRRRRPQAADPGAARPLALALLLPSGPIEAAAGQLLERDPEGPLADEARYSLAIAHGEAGQRDTDVGRARASWRTRARRRSNMARHAAALTRDPRRNAWAAFRAARWYDRRNRALWVLVGPLLRGRARPAAAAAARVGARRAVDRRERDVDARAPAPAPLASRDAVAAGGRRLGARLPGALSGRRARRRGARLADRLRERPRATGSAP